MTSQLCLFFLFFLYSKAVLSEVLVERSPMVLSESNKSTIEKCFKEKGWVEEEL